MNLFKRLLTSIGPSALRRDPDFIIGGRDNPYLLRWYVLPQNRWFNLYLHCFKRSDDDRALHDHPWSALSIVLRGGYVEWYADPLELQAAADLARDADLPHIFRYPFRHRRPGSMRFLRAGAAHRVELYCHSDDGRTGGPLVEVESWSLFLTGPKRREWGFWCPKGWRHWREFTAHDVSQDKPGNSGLIGAGCGDD
jgi:hypothetical protein